MIGQTIVMKSKGKDKFPKIIDREETESYITYIIEVSEGNLYKANVISISSSGNYTLKLFEKA